jgi:oxygen-independent coproporphyrinogen-3 oxidase
MPIGLYIHIPFCLKKCNYCDFVSYPYDAGSAASYVYALKKEMALYAAKLPPEHKTLRSIYIGGGTPTVLPAHLMTEILTAVRSNYAWPGDIEVTVEVNPGTVDGAKLSALRGAGVNRLSLGAQAVQERLLTLLGRRHGWRQVDGAVMAARRVGIDNISIDLIYGIPGQSMKDWQETLEHAAALGVEHISAYNLKIEPDTPLCRDVTAGYTVPCDEDLEVEMLYYAIDRLSEHGYRHYEISNYARPGREAGHNLIYWQNEEYLGLGPAAHSYIDGVRFANTPDLHRYQALLARGRTPVSEEAALTPRERLAEAIFLGLRLTDGVDLRHITGKYGEDPEVSFRESLDKLLKLGLIHVSDHRLRLTRKGLPLANEVFAEFV